MVTSVHVKQSQINSDLIKLSYRDRNNQLMFNCTITIQMHVKIQGLTKVQYEISIIKLLKLNNSRNSRNVQKQRSKLVKNPKI